MESKTEKTESLEAIEEDMSFELRVMYGEVRCPLCGAKLKWEAGISHQDSDIIRCKSRCGLPELSYMDEEDTFKYEKTLSETASKRGNNKSVWIPLLMNVVLLGGSAIGISGFALYCAGYVIIHGWCK